MFFLDCEASSLDREHSYPVEIAWGELGSGTVRSFLIDPTTIESWTDWDAEAEAVHGLSRAFLAEHGLPPRDVARELAEQLPGQIVWTTAPEDRAWVNELTLRTRGTQLAILWRSANDHFAELARGRTDLVEAAKRQAWDHLVAEGIRPHRAANDVLHMRETRRILQRNTPGPDNPGPR